MSPLISTDNHLFICIMIIYIAMQSTWNKGISNLHSSNQIVPIVDLGPYHLNTTANRNQSSQLIRKACKQIGFFYIINHGVSKDLQERVFQATQDFFDLPLHEKQAIDITKSGVNWKGYVDEGVEATNITADQRETLWYGRELTLEHPCVIASLPLHGSNPFPKALASFKSTVLEWLQEMDRVGRILTMALAESLGLKNNFFSEGMCKDHLGTLGLMHYPAQWGKFPGWGVSEHTDYGLLTLLMFDQPQLQAQQINGTWIQIEPIPDTFVVNIGDILEVMTQGLYKSTLHRVKNTSGKSRYSLPYFYDPHWDAKIAPLDISLSEGEKQVVEKVRACKRWDDAALHRADGIFGHYYLRKLMKTFPNDMQPQFSAYLKQ